MHGKGKQCGVSVDSRAGLSLFSVLSLSTDLFFFCSPTFFTRRV